MLNGDLYSLEGIVKLVMLIIIVDNLLEGILIQKGM